MHTKDLDSDDGDGGDDDDAGDDGDDGGGNIQLHPAFPSFYRTM